MVFIEFEHVKKKEKIWDFEEIVHIIIKNGRSVCGKCIVLCSHGFKIKLTTHREIYPH